MKKYDTYKESGIEWIGEIPEGWEVVPIKYSLLIPLTDGPHETPKLLPTGIPFISAEAIKNDKIDFNKKRGYISEEEHERFSLKYKPKLGDVYMIKSGATTGNLARVETEKEFNIWSPLAAFRPSPNKTTTDFLFFYMKSSRFFSAVELGWNYGTQQNIGMNVLENLKMLRPPISEQTQIANYLDRKTTEIDQLIADKKALVELYKEEKTAIINQAVTKGINPEAKMKDSGIEWLGEIPEHWEVIKLKYLGVIKYGLGQPPKQKIGGLPIIRATNVYRGKIDKNKLMFVDPDDIPYERDPILKENDIIIVRSGAYTADSAIIPHEYDGAVTGYDMVIRAFYTEVAKFVALSLLSDYVLKSQLLPESLRAAQPHLNREELGETLIALPVSRDEQRQIVDLIENEIYYINSKISKAEKYIDLLTEYRTALISEVVTGKIKVADS